jgi:SAM-dependent methyltransferase
MTQKINMRWIEILVILAIITAILLFFKRQNISELHEGFVQDKPFVLKMGENVYDPFYVEIYDRLMKTKERVEFEINHVINATQPDPKYATILDIGSGTGYLVDQLHKRGFKTFGLERSKAMIDYCTENYPNALIKEGNAMEPMLYENGVFSHILCMGLTIYDFKEKLPLFQNIYHWLRPGGYFIVHLVDPAKFDTIVPVGRTKWWNKTSPHDYAKQRITRTNVDFIDFTYSGEYVFDKDTIFQETFVDGMSKNVRKNERVLYMEKMQNILRMIMGVGFSSVGEATLADYNGDQYQYLYIFNKA